MIPIIIAIVAGIVLLDAVVWIIAYRVQEPSKHPKGTNLYKIRRNTNMIGANVAVISVNVVLTALAIFANLWVHLQ
jgi:hypothetical protein